MKVMRKVEDLSEEMVRVEHQKEDGSGKVVVTWGWFDEGWSGDYDEENPDDVPLLRFDVFLVRGNGEVDEAYSEGYCTAVDGRGVGLKALEEYSKVMAEEYAEREASWKKPAQADSWATTEDVNEHLPTKKGVI